MLLPLALVGLDAYLELGGVPDDYRAGILNDLTVEHGILLDASEVRVGVINGLVLEDVRLRDAQAPSVTLLTLPRLQVEIDRWALLDPTGWLQWPVQPRIEPTGFRLDGATLNMQPADPELADLHLRIQDIDADVAITPSQFRIQHFTGTVDGVRLDLRADIDRLYRLPYRRAAADTDADTDAGDSQAAEPPRGPAGRQISVQPLVARVGPRLRRAIAEARYFAASGQDDAFAQLTLRASAPAVGEPHVDFDLTAQNYLYHGLDLGQVVVAGALTPDTLQLDQLRAEWDGQEYLHAYATVDLDDETVQGSVTLQALPDKLVKAIYRQPIDSTLWPTFHDQPLYVHAEIARSPIRDLAAWRAELTVSGQDIRLVDGQLSRVSAQLAYRGDRNLRLLASDFHLAPDITGSATGMIHLSSHESWWQLVIDGDPRALAQLTDDANFRHHYGNIWKDFTFTAGARPHLAAVIYRRRVDDTLRTVVEGDATLRSVSFRGVPVDHADGHVQVDLMNHDLVVQDLRIQKGGRQAFVDLHYHFSSRGDDEQYIRFDADSQLDPQTLLGLINPNWRQYPTMYDISVVGTPHITGSGFASITGPERVTLSCHVTAPALSVGATTVKLPQFRVDFAQGDWRFRGRAERIESPELTIIGGDFSEILWPHGGSLSARGRAAAIQIQDMELLAPTFDYHYADQANHVTIAAPTFTRMAGEHPVVVRDISSPDFLWAQNRISASITAASYESAGQYAVADLDVNLDRDRDGLRIGGTTGTIRHDETRARLPSARFQAQQRDGQLDLTVTTPQAQLYDHMTLQAVDARIHQDGVRYQADLTLDRFSWQDKYIADTVTGSVSVDPNTVRWDARSRTLATPHGNATTVHNTGTHDRGSWFIDHQSDTLDYKTLPFTRASLKLLIEQDRLWVHDFEGQVYGGSITGAVFADLAQHTGKITVFGHDLSLQEVQDARRPIDAPPSSLSGTVNAHASVDYSHRGDQLLMEGDGSLKVSDGELYKVPVVNEFLTMTDALLVTRLFVSKDDAKITELDATLRFQGDRLFVPDLATNGTVVRLQGHGYYWWDTGGLDFHIQGKLLEKVFGLLPDVINPFEVLLAMRLHGSAANYEWSKSTPAWATSGTPPADPMKPKAK